MYGPVDGTGRVPTSVSGVPAGTGAAAGLARLTRKSGLGRRSWKSIVRAASFVCTPGPRSHLRGRLAHASAPTSEAKDVEAKARARKSRSRARRKSLALTTAPLE